MTAAADRHLLFGLLALQNGIINQGQLVAAFQAWTLDKSKSLADHLEARGDLTGARRALLEGLAEVHLEAHGGDVEKSLAALNSIASVRDDLSRVADPHVQDSLAHVYAARQYQDDDPYRTVAPSSVGDSTSTGTRFRILRPHAKGGLGEVFVALDTELNRDVALKEIQDHFADDPRYRARFEFEAKVTGGLEHPGIVPVYGLGRTPDGRPFYAMRFIKGNSLKEAIRRFHEAERQSRRDTGRSTLELRALLGRFINVCDAVAYAHSRRVLHRDLKPGNIMLGKYGETLVVDWGLAKSLDEPEPESPIERPELPLNPASGSALEPTLAGSAVGTPAYMSPEQVDGRVGKLGVRSDVYGLGATLYHLLTGHAPCEAEQRGEIYQKVLAGEVPRPRSLNPRVAPALEAICLKALALKPGDRYASAEVLKVDLERWLADEPVTAWREPFSRRVRRWARRNRTAVTALAASVLMALAGTAAVLAVQTRANADLKSANLDLALANNLVKEANADLKSANDRERQRFSLAMDAIKLFHGEVSDDLVLKADQFKPLRDKLLRGALDFYGKLEALLKGQPDRTSRGAMGNAYFELGELTSKIGDKPAALASHRKGLAVRRELAAHADAQARGDVAKSLHAAAVLLNETGNSAEALAHFEEARDLLEGLPISGPGWDERHALLGTVYRGIGSVLADTGKTAAAMSLYQRSVETLTRLADDNPAVTGFRSSLARTHNDIGALQWNTGKPAEAAESYRRALAIRQKLVDDNAADTEFRSSLARSHHNIGLLQVRTGKHGEALESYRMALAIQQKLVDDNPAVTDFRSSVAITQQYIGNLQQQTGKRGEALESQLRALAIWQKLADDNPAVTQFQSNLASSHDNIGLLQAQTGKPGKALESQLRALAIRQKLADDHPAVTDFQDRLASSHNNIGDLQADTGEPGEALESFQMALGIWQKLANDNPTVSRFRSRLAYCQTNAATALLRLGRSAEARILCERAVALRETLVKDHPATRAYHEGLGESLLRSGLARRDQGDDAGAAADWRRADTLLEGVEAAAAYYTFVHACCHASLSWATGRPGSGVSAGEAGAEAAKALALLRRAVAMGYRDLAAYRNETALDPLRGGPDFRLLMMDLAMPAEPFAE